MNRRSFLKLMGAAGLVLVSDPSRAFDALEADETPAHAMIIDLERCMGCQACAVTCRLEGKRSGGGFDTRVSFLETGHYPSARHYFVPLQCNQCSDPPCMAACSAGAITRLPSGIVFTDWSRCDGSGACVDACPFGMRRMVDAGGRKSAKCDFCLDRLLEGQRPLCVETCPSRARIFGDLKRPEGEFRLYLQGRPLFRLSMDEGIEGRVYYAGNEVLARLALGKEGTGRG